MQQPTIEPQKIEKNAWKQGACLSVDESTEIYITTQCMQERLPAGLYIILSQDCDILNISLEKEPVVELLRANKVQQPNPELISGKNPRQLHIKIDETNECLEVFPHQRFFIARNYLEAQKANQILIIDRSLKILIKWINNRYKRPGFPHAFNCRNSKIIKNIQKILSEEAKETYGLYIQLSSENELPENETYSILVKLLLPKNIYENEQQLLEIEKGFDLILSLLNNVKGIKTIEGSQVQSMDDITVHQYQELKKWDFDYISFINGENGEII